MLPDTGAPPGLTAPTHGRTLYFHYAWVIIAMISVVQIVEKPSKSFVPLNLRSAKGVPTEMSLLLVH